MTPDFDAITVDTIAAGSILAFGYNDFDSIIYIESSVDDMYSQAGSLYKISHNRLLMVFINGNNRFELLEIVK